MCVGVRKVLWIAAVFFCGRAFLLPMPSPSQHPDVIVVIDVVGVGVAVMIPSLRMFMTILFHLRYEMTCGARSGKLRWHVSDDERRSGGTASSTSTVTESQACAETRFDGVSDLLSVCFCGC